MINWSDSFSSFSSSYPSSGQGFASDQCILENTGPGSIFLPRMNETDLCAKNGGACVHSFPLIYINWITASRHHLSHRTENLQCNDRHKWYYNICRLWETRIRLAFHSKHLLQPALTTSLTPSKINQAENGGTRSSCSANIREGSCCFTMCEW